MASDDPTTCDGCGEWFYPRELRKDQCAECRGLADLDVTYVTLTSDDD